MANDVFKVRRLDDRTIYDIFTRANEAARAAADEGGEPSEQIRFAVEFFGVSVLGRLDFGDSAPQAGKYTIRIAKLTLTTEVNRSGRPNENFSVDFSLRRGDDGEFDELRITQPSNASGQSPFREGRGRAAIVAAFDELNRIIAPASSDPATALGKMSNYAESIDNSFRGFTQGVEGVLSTLAEQRAEEQRLMEAERQRLREEIIEERDRLLERAMAEIEERERRVKELEEGLAEREAQLDIKSHKDARRALFRDIQKTLQDAAQKPAHGFMVGFVRVAVFFTLLLAGGMAGYLSLNALSADDLGENASNIQIWAVILKPIGLTLVAFAAFAAAVQWLRHFYTRDLQVSDEFLRFQHDMARASWIIEATLEMEKEHQTQIPKEWLENVTEGLFRGRQPDSNMDQGQHALAALLGLSTSVKAGPDGLEIETNQRGARRMARAARKQGG